MSPNPLEAHARLLRWPNTVFARALVNVIQRAHKDFKLKKDMASIQRSLYLLSGSAICPIFLPNRAQCSDGFSRLIRRYAEKGNNTKNTVFFPCNRESLVKMQRMHSK